MNKTSIISRTENLLKDILKDKEINLVEVDYVKENNIYYLKVYLDTDKGITIDECSEVSRELSKLLDDEEFIENSYFLEVSSPGIDRPFKSVEDYGKNINEIIEINLYAKKNNQKKFIGKLINIAKDSITIEIDDKDKSKYIFNFDEISKANKHIDF